MPPALPIVDSHVHLLDPGSLTYAWLSGIPDLDRPHLPQHLFEASSPLDVERIVVVQAEVERSQYRAEVAWVSRLARTSPRIAGLVSWAPLERGTAVAVELEELAANPLVKGVRRIIENERDPGFCLGRDFVDGVRLLAGFDLGFDLCIRHHQLGAATGLVRACPRVRFVLDHVGKPDVRGGVLDPWREDLRALARLPNVWCKLSGLATEADRDRWRFEDLEPFIDHAIACFGFARCMYGSDWPVARQATSYLRWVDTLDRVVRGCSADEARLLFRDTAVSFYRLGGTGPTGNAPASPAGSPRLS
jgi:L-fuconolactonase